MKPRITKDLYARVWYTLYLCLFMNKHQLKFKNLKNLIENDCLARFKLLTLIYSAKMNFFKGKEYQEHYN